MTAAATKVVQTLLETEDLDWEPDPEDPDDSLKAHEIRTARVPARVPPVRLRVRRVNEMAIVQKAVRAAVGWQRPAIIVSHGGSVANAYGYPADTEGIVAVGWPDGTYWYEVTRLPANKVTLSGVFSQISGLRGLFDSRFSLATRTLVREKFIAQISSRRSGSLKSI